MKQILIVEDDNLLNKTLVYNLASDGYNITSATNAKDATNKLQNQQYDMVLLMLIFLMETGMIYVN